MLRDFKKFTSQRIVKAIEENIVESRKRWLMWLLTNEKASEDKAVSYRFWQPDNHAEICFSLSFMWQKLAYIHDNPVRAGIVDKAEYYKSSAADYVYGKQMGRVKIAWLDAMVVTVLGFCLGRLETCFIPASRCAELIPRRTHTNISKNKGGLFFERAG